MDDEVRTELLERMSSFDGEIHALGRLIADLDVIWSTEQWSELERRGFRREWGTLEQIYAEALDQQMALDPERQAEVRAQLDLLRSMLPVAHDQSG